MVIYFTDFCMSKLERHGSVEYEDICYEYNNRTIRTIPWMKEAILYQSLESVGIHCKYSVE
jgi:hypothetical protein